MARPGRDGQPPAPLKLGLLGDPLPPEEVPLATPDDVARVLGVEPTPDPPFAEKELETASSWARKFLRWPDLGQVGEVVEKFYHVQVDGYLNTNGVPVSVSVVTFSGEKPVELEESVWEFDGEGIRLMPSPSIWLVNDEELESPWASERDWYARVEVTTALPEEVDPLIRDGVAVAAAAVLTRAPRAAKGMIGERIGDYSYTLAKAMQGDPFFEEAKSMLRPFRVIGSLVP